MLSLDPLHRRIQRFRRLFDGSFDQDFASFDKLRYNLI